MRDIDEETISSYLRNKAADSIKRTCLFGRSGKLTFPRTPFEYEYDVRWLVAENDEGVIIVMKEPEGVLIELSEAPKSVQEIIAKYWKLE